MRVKWKKYNFPELLCEIQCCNFGIPFVTWIVMLNPFVALCDIPDDIILENGYNAISMLE